MTGFENLLHGTLVWNIAILIVLIVLTVGQILLPALVTTGAGQDES